MNTIPGTGIPLTCLDFGFFIVEHSLNITRSFGITVYHHALLAVAAILLCSHKAVLPHQITTD